MRKRKIINDNNIIRRNLLTAVIFVLAISHAPLLYALNGPYLCVAKSSTGFLYGDVDWEIARFNVDNEKFIIRQLKDSELKYRLDRDERYIYGVFEFGNEYPARICRSYENSVFCDWGLGNLYFSADSMRYLSTYVAGGYWHGEDNNENTPNITIGNCTKL